MAEFDQTKFLGVSIAESDLSVSVGNTPYAQPEIEVSDDLHYSTTRGIVRVARKPDDEGEWHRGEMRRNGNRSYCAIRTGWREAANLVGIEMSGENVQLSLSHLVLGELTVDRKITRPNVPSAVTLSQITLLGRGAMHLDSGSLRIHGLTTQNEGSLMVIGHSLEPFHVAGYKGSRFLPALDSGPCLPECGNGLFSQLVQGE